MKHGMTILCATLALGLAACVQVGPSNDKPLHIIMDVNIKIQVDKDVADMWDSVEAMAETGSGASESGEPEEND